MPGLLSYKKRQIAAQLQLLAASEYFTTAARQGNGEYRKKTYPFVLPREFRSENLLSSIRQETETYFEDNKIAWHDARAHLLSSQIFCINFLGPFAQHPNALKELFEPLVGPIATMLEPEPKEVGRFVAFEFIGDPDVDYLNESSGRKRTRGANCTSADAAIRFQRPDGTTEFALIEWKYTESYRSSPSPQESEEQFNKRIEREHRYSNIAFAPNGPLRKDLSLKLADLFVDPIYQMLRQQMLAYRMEQAHELGAMRVTCISVFPVGNLILKRVNVPALRRLGDDIADVWRNLLEKPDRFLSVSSEQLFQSFAKVLYNHPDLKLWHSYVGTRYGLNASDSAVPSQAKPSNRAAG